jgi:hypothetical protein
MYSDACVDALSQRCPCVASFALHFTLQRYGAVGELLESKSCRCYLRLVDNPRAKEALKAYLPKSLITAQLPFREAAENDQQLMQLLLQLRSSVGIKAPDGIPGE